MRIKTREAFDQDLRAAARSIDLGKEMTPIQTDSFESLDALLSVLTETRLGLWRISRDQKPESMTVLATPAGRHLKNVSLNLLAADAERLGQRGGKLASDQAIPALRFANFNECHYR